MLPSNSTQTQSSVKHHVQHIKDFSCLTQPWLIMLKLISSVIIYLYLIYSVLFWPTYSLLKNVDISNIDYNNSWNKV